MKARRLTNQVAAPDQLLTAREAAARLGKTSRWILKLARTGQLRSQRLGNIVVFDQRDLDRFQPRPVGRPRQAPPRAPAGEQYIYCFQVAGGGPVKIGRSRCPRTRLSQLQTSCPLPLVFLAAWPGDESAEKEMHARFAAERLKGEWFTPSPDLIAYVLLRSLPPGRHLIVEPQTPREVPAPAEDLAPLDQFLIKAEEVLLPSVPEPTLDPRLRRLAERDDQQRGRLAQYSEREAASLLGYPAEFLARLRRGGYIRHHALGARFWYMRSDLEDFIAREAELSRYVSRYDPKFGLFRQYEGEPFPLAFSLQNSSPK